MIGYWRYGYTFLNEELEVSIIPFRHNEFARYLQVAFPYYLNVILIMVGYYLSFLI